LILLMAWVWHIDWLEVVVDATRCVGWMILFEAARAFAERQKLW